MGSKVSKPAEPEQKLYAVATPHPTLQYIYPVYASPIDLSKTSSTEKKGRSSPLTWRNEKSKGKREIQIIDEPVEHLHQELPVGINDDGAWYHFHVDADGDVDYIRPGTTLPTAFQKNQAMYPSYVADESIAPSMAGTPYQDSYYSYSAAPAYQGYHHPQPQRISQSDAYSAGSTPYHPRARSVSPVHSRAMTPTNMRPRRATTPTPKGSRTPIYEPAPPMPQDIVLLPRRVPPSSFNAKSLPSVPASRGTDAREYARPQAIEYRSERRADGRDRSPDYSRTAASRTLASHRPSMDGDNTAVSSPYHGSKAVVVKPTHPRPYSPRDEDEEEEEDEEPHTYHHSRSPNKHPRDYYPSPSSLNSDRRVQTRRY
ncbi:hypothetical protein PIIN_06754 [Serendipita indica DSM 11827]|uniref:Uncharacterized protein n=1 Tax=Serendipita indica (strain DSM 11827) TaxID=1109443 RepID=G4TNC1_SERID|nr:hypothetical protein PIIN_06754 [Serendipita indica DSM 11827]